MSRRSNRWHRRYRDLKRTLKRIIGPRDVELPGDDGSGCDSRVPRTSSAIALQLLIEQRGYVLQGLPQKDRRFKERFMRWDPSR